MGVDKRGALLAVGAIASLGALYAVVNVVGSRRRFSCRCRRRVPPEERASVDVHNTAHARELELTPTERGLVMRARTWKGSMKVALVVTFKGPKMAKNDVIAMAKSLQRRHPILRCRVEDTFMLEDKDVRVRVDVLDGKTWEQTWTEIEKEPFQEGDCVLRILLLRGSSGAGSEQEMAFVCEHAFCDGVSISNLAHEAMCLLADTGDIDASSSLPWSMPMEVCADANSPNVLVKVWRILRIVATIMMRQKASLFPAADESIAAPDLIHHCTTAVSYAELTPAQTKKLLRLCRKYKTTITGAIAASMEIACTDFMQPNDWVSVGCGVGMRRRYDPPMEPYHLAYHVSGALGCLHKITDKSASVQEIWKLAVRYRQGLKAQLEQRFPLTIANMAGADYENASNHEVGSTSSISNWGIVPLRATYGDWHIIGSRPVVNMSYIRIPAILATTTLSKLTCAFLGPTPAYSANDLAAYCDKTRGCLLRMLTIDEAST